MDLWIEWVLLFCATYTAVMVTYVYYNLPTKGR